MKRSAIQSTNMIIFITAILVGGAILGTLFIFTDIFNGNEKVSTASINVLQVAGKTTKACNSNSDCVGVCDTTKNLIPSCTISPEDGSFCSCLEYDNITQTDTLR